MGFKKTHWLFHLLALIVIVILASARCGHDTADKNPPSIKEAPHDCPPDNSCAEGHCATNPVNNNQGEEQEKEKNEVVAEAKSDAGGNGLDTTRNCDTAEDCGCGYECADSQCRKVDSSCCANADCQDGYFCSYHDDATIGTCKPWECDTDNHCNRCGAECIDHLCVQNRCCADADCPKGELCTFSYNADGMGWCIVPECTSDADCECGEFCSKHSYRCTSHNDPGRKPQKNKPCCGDDVYYDDNNGEWAGYCYLRERVENGHCLGDEHCPTGQVCLERELCVPTTCQTNADCGCEAVCRKGNCEIGCDSNSDCCDEEEICDRGQCIDPNAEDEEGSD